MESEDQADIVAFLRDARTHGLTGEVEAIETHISRIFLAGDRAFKLKRAVKLPYLDFSTPELRLKACEREVELNAAGAPGLYLAALGRDDYPEGRLEIMHQSYSLPYGTFDILRSMHRAEVVDNKRLDDMLPTVAETQAGRELERSKRGPRRTGQTDHMFRIRDGSTANGYQKRGRRTDFVNDPEVNAKRQKSVEQLDA